MYPAIGMIYDKMYRKGSADTKNRTDNRATAL